MTQEYYSNGKLLLSGEYAILDGAIGWAVPTKFGQHLTITENTAHQMTWQSINDKGAIWFECVFTLNDFSVITTTNTELATTLRQILSQTRVLRPNFLTTSKGCNVQTKLSFPRQWGLGTSSTLINNIALWAGVDPYLLLAKTFGGSGYDIACAQNNHAILFRLENGSPTITPARTQVPFADSLYFVYLNHKKNSREAISAYRKLAIDKKQLTENISHLTQAMLNASTLSSFEEALNEHEQTLSNTLKVDTIKNKHFSDYSGSVKSLGGWGGDFVLATARENPTSYFKSKGYNTILPYKKMVL